MHSTDSLGPTPIHLGVAMSLSLIGSVWLWRLSSPTATNDRVEPPVPTTLRIESVTTPKLSPDSPTEAVDVALPVDVPAESPPEPVAYIGGPTATLDTSPADAPPSITAAAAPSQPRPDKAESAAVTPAEPPRPIAALAPATLTASAADSDLPAADAVFENGVYMPAFTLRDFSPEVVRRLTERELGMVVVFCGDQRFALNGSTRGTTLQPLSRADRSRLSRRGIAAPTPIVRQALEQLRSQYGLTSSSAAATQVRVVLTLPLDAVVRQAQQHAARQLGLPIEELKCTRGYLEWRESIDKLFVVEAVELNDGRCVNIATTEL